MSRNYSTEDRVTMVKIGQRLRNQREKLGLSRKQVAVSMGVQEPALYRWEKGARGLSAVQLEQLSRALVISTDRLLGLV
jgi:transcriptional regulator with XRE-family HTH domain